jgi:hypothetical protein
VYLLGLYLNVKLAQTRDRRVYQRPGRRTTRTTRTRLAISVVIATSTTTKSTKESEEVGKAKCHVWAPNFRQWQMDHEEDAFADIIDRSHDGEQQQQYVGSMGSKVVRLAIVLGGCLRPHYMKRAEERAIGRCAVVSTRLVDDVSDLDLLVRPNAKYGVSALFETGALRNTGRVRHGMLR